MDTNNQSEQATVAETPIDTERVIVRLTHMLELAERELQHKPSLDDAEAYVDRLCSMGVSIYDITDELAVCNCVIEIYRKISDQLMQRAFAMHEVFGTPEPDEFAFATKPTVGHGRVFGKSGRDYPSLGLFFASSIPDDDIEF